MSLNTSRYRDRRSESGSIIIMTAIFMLGLFLMVARGVDVSRIYMLRAEMQNAADAAALTAARELNAGTTGIDNAVSRAMSIVNTQGFARIGVTISSVRFSVNPDGPYLTAGDAKDPAVVTTIRYVRVDTQAASTPILFAIN